MEFLTPAEFNDAAGHKEGTAQLKVERCKDFGLDSSGRMMQLLSLAARPAKVWDPLLKIIKGEVTAPAVLKSNSTRRSGHQRKDAVNPV